MQKKPIKALQLRNGRVTDIFIQVNLCLPLNSGSCLGLECLELSLGNIVVMTADLPDLFQLLDSFLVLPAHLQLQKTIRKSECQPTSKHNAY